MFFTSPLKHLNGMQQNLTGSKISTCSTKFVFFGLIRKPRWPPWPIISWNIFDFYETAEQNFNGTWQAARFQSPLPSLCFLCRSGKQDGRLGLWLAETFLTSFFSEITERNSTKYDRKQDRNGLCQVCVFRGPIGMAESKLKQNYVLYFIVRWLGFGGLLEKILEKMN